MIGLIDYDAGNIRSVRRPFGIWGRKQFSERSAGTSGKQIN